MSILIASYSESNIAAYYSLGNGNELKVAQSFNNPRAAFLTSCKFSLKKVGTVSGNAVATLYPVSGTFGVNAVPTGTALATSLDFDVSVITGTDALYEFTFDGNYTMIPGNYFIAIEYSGGDISNYIEVGTDLTQAYGPNSAFFDTIIAAWEADSSSVPFYVYGILAGAPTNVFLMGAQTQYVQAINASHSDDGTPIYYELETQELEFGDRGHLKKIANDIGILTTDGLDSSILLSSDVQDYRPIPMDLSERVAIGNDINAEGHYFQFKWYGEVDSSSPMLEGLYVENVNDLGITQS